jgi:TRAP-type C4-dicarboxylate transport system substrate-binding protein
MGLQEWNDYTGNNLTIHSSDREKVVDYVNEGKIDIATTYVETLGKLENHLYVLGLPFLFNDHEHAYRVLDGKIGKSLFEKLESKTNLKGLAFTYSGGFRIIPSVKALESVKDFYNLKVACSKSPVSFEMFKAVEADPIPMLVDEINEAMKQGKIEAGTTTYARFFLRDHHETAKYINDTQHSLFLTSIVTNKNVWNSMSEKDRQVWAEAAMQAAKIEREESIKDNYRVQKEAANYGIETVQMTSIEKTKFANSLKSVYPKFESVFGNDLIDGIKVA